MRIVLLSIQQGCLFIEALSSHMWCGLGDGIYVYNLDVLYLGHSREHLRLPTTLPS
jgi:hypothetical protein